MYLFFTRLFVSRTSQISPDAITEIAFTSFSCALPRTKKNVLGMEVKMKQIRWLFFLVCILLLGGCGLKETKMQSQRSTPFEVDTKLFTYEGTKKADVIAVDEEGYLYTATCLTNWDEVVMEDGVYEPFIQQMNVYDLQGNLIREAKLKLGRGSISTLFVDGTKLYAIVRKADKESQGPALYEIDTQTWKATELYHFETYYYIPTCVRIGEYFYVVGKAKEVSNQDDETYQNMTSYTDARDCVTRIHLESEVLQEEILPVDIPLDIVKTKEDTLLIYHYDEENGLGFMEFRPEEMVLEQIGWAENPTKASNFTQCEDGFVFYRNGKLRYGTANNVESVLTGKEVFLGKTPTYQRGFLFYQVEDGVKRLEVTNVMEQNTPIEMLLPDEDISFEPVDSGNLVKKTVVEPSEYTEKVFTQDTDFDMYLLESRGTISYQIKEKGTFYALNEVEGVREYLDACFPYLKEAATNEDGDIWMIPIGSAVSTLLYHKAYCEENGVDYAQMHFSEFLTLVEEVEVERPEKGCISTFLLIEELFEQYLNVYDTFDTEVFRTYAKQIRSIEENAGRLYLGEDYIGSVRETTIIGVNDNVYTEQQLAQIPNFFYDNELFIQDGSYYTKRLGQSDLVSVAGMPKVENNTKNIAIIGALIVNPKSKNLKATLEYISDVCKYMLEQKDTFLLADEAMYSDYPFIKQNYEIYKEGSVHFAMDMDVYWNTFWDYVKGNIELEKMIKEIEQKRKNYVGE